MIRAIIRSSETAPRPIHSGRYGEASGITVAASPMVTNGSAMAVTTCTARKPTASSERLRCSPVTANLGSPGSRPCLFTMMPSTMTAVSSTRQTTPVARLAYQSAVLEVIPLIGQPPLRCRRIRNRTGRRQRLRARGRSG